MEKWFVLHYLEDNEKRKLYARDRESLESKIEEWRSLDLVTEFDYIEEINSPEELIESINKQ